MTTPDALQREVERLRDALSAIAAEAERCRGIQGFRPGEGRKDYGYTMILDVALEALAAPAETRMEER